MIKQNTCNFQKKAKIDENSKHTHDHSIINEHGHTHEQYDNAGKYNSRDKPLFEKRDWNERAFTVGIGGYF